MSGLQKTTIRYSDCFKRKVAEEVSRGSSLSEASRHYGIRGGNTVRGWIKRYGREDLLNEIIYVKMRKETNRIKELEEKTNGLKSPLPILHWSGMTLKVWLPQRIVIMAST